MTPKLFSELGLSAEMLKAIDKLGFEQAAPIQAEAIPILLQGKDVVGQSQTGSGKTAAFAIPAIEKVDTAQRTTQVLILCPTRELAVQVSEEVHKLALFKRGLHALPVYGGQSYDRQLYGLRQGAHIVIGTPGRVMDHLRRGTLRLNTLKMVILDEVDVMLNMGFRDDIETILTSTPKERQTVFFSATIPKPIQQMIAKFSREPQDVRIKQVALTVPTVEQVYYEVNRRYKIELLTRLIDHQDLKLGIIFCNTKRMVDELVDHLNAQGYSADRLHGDLSQAMRDRVMNKFRKSGLEFLVATDVAARGIDVDDVEVVFNYDLPYDGEDYIHRIGRTGRKGRKGLAISFAAGREVFQIRNIERYTNTRIQRGKPPTAGEVEEARANVFFDKLRAILKGGEFKRQDPLLERLLEEGYASTDVASALIHQLQSSEAAAAKPAPRESEAPRPERAGGRFEDRAGGRFEDRAGGRFEDRAPGRFEERAPGRFARREVRDVREVRDNGEERKREPYRPDPRFPQRAPQEGRAPRPDSRPMRADARPPRREETAARVAPRVVAPKAVATAASKPAPAPAKAVEVAAASVADKPVAVAPAPASKPVVTASAAPATTKTFSDAEIMASVKTPPPEPMPPHKFAKGKPAPFAGKPRPSRATPDHQTRLWMNVGEAMGVVAIDVVNTVAGETGLPGKIVGTVDVRERHLFADVAAEHANSIVAKLNRTSLKGHKLKVKIA